MKTLFLSAFGLLFSGFLHAQEPVRNNVNLIDSIRLKSPELQEPEPALDYSETFTPFNLISPAKLILPDFDLSKWLHSNWNVSYSYFGSPALLSGGNASFAFGIFNPGWGGVYTIFSEATYRLNGKLLIGGNSFGSNPFNAATFVHPGSEQWGVRGASVFMEYKVSKNFRIGAGVTLTEKPLHP